MRQTEEADAMVRFTLIALAGAALLPVVTTGATAQTYSAQSRYAPVNQTMSYEQCVRQQRNRQVTGAVIGGILGAVIGAEIHDDRQDRDRAHRDYRRDRYYHRGRGYRDRGYRGRNRGRDYRRGHYHEEGNDGAVLAGAGLGALAGAAVAGAGGGQGCERYLHDNARYGHSGYNQPSHYAGGGYSNPGYSNDGYAYSDQGYQDDWSYDGPAQYSSDSGAYGGASSGEVLLGGEDYGRETRSYTASSMTASVNTGPCRTMRSGNGADVLMCQGLDGIWRPAD